MILGVIEGVIVGVVVGVLVGVVVGVDVVVFVGVGVGEGQGPIESAEPPPSQVKVYNLPQTSVVSELGRYIVPGVPSQFIQ